jgi:hypothetical protein
LGACRCRHPEQSPDRDRANEAATHRPIAFR